eukprot:5349487-Prymnesium_polylepis.1
MAPKNLAHGGHAVQDQGASRLLSVHCSNSECFQCDATPRAREVRQMDRPLPTAVRPGEHLCAKCMPGRLPHAHHFRLGVAPRRHTHLRCMLCGLAALAGCVQGRGGSICACLSPSRAAACFTAYTWADIHRSAKHVNAYLPGLSLR